jgi:hypothetical protein
MSSVNKSQGTTSRLLEAAMDVLRPNSTRYLDLVQLIEESHLDAARLAVADSDIHQRVCQELKHDLQRLRNFLEAAEVCDILIPSLYPISCELSLAKETHFVHSVSGEKFILFIMILNDVFRQLQCRA